MTAIKLGFTLALLAALVSPACRPSADETSIVVRVLSDETLSLDRVEMTARRLSAGGGGANASDTTKSVSFTDPANVTWVLYPTGADKGFAIQIEAIGRKGEVATITQRATIPFQKGQRVEITMSLDDGCLQVDCPSPLTCEHGACIDPSFVGRPDHLGDGGDAGPVERPATDGAVDRKDGASPDVPQGSKALGDACTANADCASTHCADGVCCNDTCGGSCQQCNNEGTMRGYCQSVAAGQPAPSGHPACTAADASTCKQTGTCDGKGACALFANGTVCRAAACDATANNLTDSRCDGMGTCKPGTPITCAPFRCKAGQTACTRTCATNADCDGQPCVNLSCGKLKVGAACTNDTDCELGFCTDGVCCDVRCAGQCQACNLSSSVGRCSPVMGGDDVGTCTGTTTCNAAGACTKKTGQTCTATTECASGQCVDGHCCDTPCTGSCLTCATGTCSPVRGADDPNTCTGTMTCNASGVCTRKNGQTCTGTGDCSSGNCVDGHCCDTPCTGSCLTCATGTCSPVRGADDPGTCTGTMTCNASGVCSKKLGQTCTAGSECVAGFCADGRCCDAACTGTCLTCSAAGACAPVVNGEDNTCTGASTCNANGVCLKKQGQVCGAGTECVTGNCVDGHCCNGPCNLACQTCSTGVCSQVVNAPDVGTCSGTQTCNATGMCCTTQQTVCATRACGSAQDNCGATFTCPNTCPVLPNSLLSCNVNSCAYTCAAGIFQLPCRTTTNAACGRWDFESNQVEGWSSDDASPPAPSTLNPFSGTHSLRVPLTFLPNPFTLLQVPLCAQGVNLSGKRLTAHLTFISAAGFPPISVADGVVATLEVVGPNGAFARVAEVDGVISPNQFVMSGTVPAGSPPTFTTLEMFFVGDTRPWQGTVYVDDVRIEN
ncbi:MAG TPA: hypothetical protein VFH68_21980 [Polyangia bacterium]|nr:hypothetical protein [Polyangia bacterium]